MKIAIQAILLIPIILIFSLFGSYLGILIFGIKELPEGMITQSYCDTSYQQEIRKKEADLKQCEGEKAVCENGLKRVEEQLKILFGK